MSSTMFRRLSTLLIVCCISLYARAEDGGITISKKNMSLTKLIELIESKTDYSFWYRIDLPSRTSKISLSVKDATIGQVMDLSATGQPFTYTIIGKLIILKIDSSFARIHTKGSKKPSRATTKQHAGNEERLSTSSTEKMESHQINQTQSGNIFSNTSINGLETHTDSRGNTTMQIRGRNSIAAGTEPLVLLDGTPYVGDIKQLNPATIESVEVLKDGGATAIYGSRGANGVILIKTKKATLPEEGKELPINPAERLITEKNGIYHYDGAHVYAIFKQMSEHYNIEVTYQSGIPAGFYKGRIPVSLSVKEMLDVLSASGIRFNEEMTDKGKQKITVL